MTKTHLLGPFVRRFLLEHIIQERNLSPRTQASYREAILLLFRFLLDRHGTDPTQVTVEQVDADLVRDFLRDLEQRRGNSAATRNQRLAALRSLFRFIACRAPELVEHAARVRAIPTRRAPVPAVPALEKAEVEALLAAPDQGCAQGRRDHALLLLLYNTGARASEVAGLTLHDLTLVSETPSVTYLDKGRKQRVCPLWQGTVQALRATLGARLDGPSETPVFLGQRGEALTRHGVYDLVARATRAAAKTAPSVLDKRVSPHTWRHTTAVHLLRANVDINTIRAWLGHVSLETTNRYAEVDLEMKARALDACAQSLPAASLARALSWHGDKDLLARLDSM